MIAQPLGDLGLVVLLVLLDRDHLRGAGLAAARVLGLGEGARAGAFLVDAGHRALDEVDVLGLERHALDHLGLEVLALAAAHVVDLRDEVRAIHRAAVEQRRERIGELHRRVGVVALADADRDRLAGVPLLLLGAAEALLLPLGRGQHALAFAAQVDAGARAEAEVLHEGRDRVDAHVVRELVVVRVGRDHDRLHQVDRAVAAFLRVAKAPAAELEVAEVVDGAVVAALAELERGHRHEGLEGRARRVDAVGAAVEQRPVDRGVELVPALGIDAVDEQVGIEAGLGDEGEHRAVRRVEGDERAAPVAEGVLGHLLELEVERQRHVVAGLRRRA